MRIVVLDSFPADQGAPVWQGLSQLGQVALHPRTRPDELLERAAGAEVLITNKVVLDGDTLARLPALRYIGVCATGTNIVDVDAARQRGIAVTNVPGYGPESVAQAVFAAILHFAHDVAAHDAAVKAGDWARSPDFSFFRKPLFELAGKRLVLLGLGAIGQAVARIGRGFAMDVVAAAVPGSPTSADRVDLAQALPRADLVSLHCPLTPATTRLVDAAFLAQLPAHAILINTARGGLIDEPALLASLRAGHLRGVALDVLAKEPPPADHPLTDPRAPFADRVLVTPHMAWGTAEARARLRAKVADNLAAFQRGERRNRVD
jgi:glycerate dehydrogenase